MDGSSWTEVNDLNQARDEAGSNGTQTSALAMVVLIQEHFAYRSSWNGTNWTEVNDLNTARTRTGRSWCRQHIALAIGG